MFSHRGIFRKNAFIVYVSIVVLSICSHFVLKINWEQIIKSILNYYGEISICFSMVSFFLIPFRLFYVKQKRITPEIRNIRLLGPLIDLTIEPLFNASLFYSAMFMLHVIFQEQDQGLTFDSFLILLVVAGILLYGSISYMYDMVLEIFFIEATEEVIQE